MDFLDSGCKLTHLHKDEITHELSIRKLPYNPSSRRNSLCQALKQTAKLSRRGSLLVADLTPADVASELEICRRKADEIGQALAEDLAVSAIDRLSSRCRYLLCRLSRLSDNPEGVAELKEKIKLMLEKLKENNSSNSDSESDQGSSSSSEQVTRIVKKIIYQPEKSFNINSLNLKFKGDTCVRNFVSRLEELRLARNLSEAQIFRGFPEILDGPALSWFRSNRSNFKTYREIIVALKEDFDIPDLDHLLLQEIRARTQAKSETIVSFVSTILGMFDRLEKKVSEEMKLDILSRNIRPEYSRDLALQDIHSIEHLKALCKRIELSQVKAAQFREPNSSNQVEKSSPAPARNSEVRNKFPNRHSMSKHFVASVSKNNSRPPCFRCGMNNHSTSVCRNSREIVCYKCGAKGVRTPDCPKCGSIPKN